MAFILSTQRDRDVDSAFAFYRSYLAPLKATFPNSAYALATSDWYFDGSDHRSPHDGMLKQCVMRRDLSKQGTLSIRILLQGAFQDGEIEFVYPLVSNFKLAHLENSDGWRYDEFRLKKDGKIVHEIQWQSAKKIKTWIIEANDVNFRWLPERGANAPRH